MSKQVTTRQKRNVASFAGCGFMAMYHVGVGLAVQQRSPGLLSQMERLYGSSAGSIVAVFAACELPSWEGYKFVKELFDKAHSVSWWGRLASLHPKFDLVGHVRSFLERVLPRDAHRTCTGKVGISLTVVPTLESWIVSDFNTRAELIQAIVCSCFIPLYCGVKLPKFRGKYCCDGGFSSNLPFSDDPSVITISPFSGECDICPASDDESYYQLYLWQQTMDVSVSNIHRGIGVLFLLSWKEMEKLCAQGYNDTLNFLKREGVEYAPLPVASEATPTSDEATSDYFSIATPSHSRHPSIVDDVVELSPVRKSSHQSLMITAHQTTDALKWYQPEAMLRLGEEVWSRMSDHWLNFMHKLSQSHPERLPAVHKLWEIQCVLNQQIIL